MSHQLVIKISIEGSWVDYNVLGGAPRFEVRQQADDQFALYMFWPYCTGIEQVGDYDPPTVYTTLDAAMQAAAQAVVDYTNDNDNDGQ